MTPVAPDLSAQIQDLVRKDRGRLLAGLIRALGDFQLAEECLQDALEAALRHWGRSGMPAHPQGWLMRVARRKAIDRLRRAQNFACKAREIAVLTQEDEQFSDNSEIPDERLRLIFTCCHPALAQKSRIALTLRLLGGLTTEEIARAFLDKTPAMAARLTRAKAKIRDADIAFAVPEGPQMAARLQSVLGVIYLIFNEGYAATSGAHQVRQDLCDEALYLARLMQDLAPEQAEIEGLLALILLSHARHLARHAGGENRAGNGTYIPLAKQDRSLWNMEMMREGEALVAGALARGQVGPYQVQAAISALHMVPGDTDWPQITALYQLLMRIDPSPIVALNLAVARAEIGGAKAGLAEIKPLAEALGSYQPYHATRADFLCRVGQVDGARAAFETAIALTGTKSEREFLRAKLAQL